MEKAFTFIIFYFVDILILPVDSGRHMGPPCPSPPSHGRSFKLNHGIFQCTDMPRAYAVPFRHPSLSALQNSSDANVPHSPSITSRVSSFRRYHTQFAQIALVVPSRTAFEDMGSRGSGPAGAAFAGHSLGEFSRLPAVTDILPNFSLVDIVFYCSLTCSTPSTVMNRAARVCAISYHPPTSEQCLR